MSFKKLFDISFLHNFYAAGVIPDVSIAPTIETIALLKNLKMIYKSNSAGEQMLYKTRDSSGTPFIEADKDLDFLFTIHPKYTAEFQNITNLDQGSPNKTYTKGKIPLFENDPSAASTDVDHPEEIRHVLLDAVRPKVFTYYFTLDPVPTPGETLLKVTAPDGSVETISYNEETEITPNSDGNYFMPIDYSQKPSGKYTFTVRNAADDTDLQTELIYLDNELKAIGLQGLIHIRYDLSEGFLYGDPEFYGITFIRKQSKWVYYVANKNGQVDLADIDIEDTSEDTSDLDIPYETYRFNKGVEPDPNISINGYDTVVFTSLEDIPFYERPKLHLNLKVVDDVIIENLPNPPLAGVSGAFSEIFVFL